MLVFHNNTPISLEEAEEALDNALAIKMVTEEVTAIWPENEVWADQRIGGFAQLLAWGAGYSPTRVRDVVEALKASPKG